MPQSDGLLWRRLDWPTSPARLGYRTAKRRIQTGIHFLDEGTDGIRCSCFGKAADAGARGRYRGLLAQPRPIIEGRQPPWAAPARRSVRRSGDGPQVCAPRHRPTECPDRPAASAPARPGSMARFSTAKRVASASISSSAIANPTACRHLACQSPPKFDPSDAVLVQIRLFCAIDLA